MLIYWLWASQEKCMIYQSFGSSVKKRRELPKVWTNLHFKINYNFTFSKIFQHCYQRPREKNFKNKNPHKACLKVSFLYCIAQSCKRVSLQHYFWRQLPIIFPHSRDITLDRMKGTTYEQITKAFNMNLEKKWNFKSHNP